MSLRRQAERHMRTPRRRGSVHSIHGEGGALASTYPPQCPEVFAWLTARAEAFANGRSISSMDEVCVHG